jgi:hypothetical protein
MTTDLELSIYNSTLCSTHEHTEFERFYIESTPDILVHLFDNYVLHDLFSAGSSRVDLNALLDVGQPDIEARFKTIQPAWERVQLTGYGEAVTLTAQRLFGIEDISPESLHAAQDQNVLNGQPGERLKILKTIANLDHVQVDTTTRPLPVEMLGQDFFHYDINLCDFCNGTPELQSLETLLGQEITNLEGLTTALNKIFQTSAKYAIAVKSQHAYGRTLAWEERSQQDAEVAFAEWLLLRKNISLSSRLCLGDWCLARIAELSMQYDLPVKLHTGYHADNDFMPLIQLNCAHMSKLFNSYPETRFLLMHISYPYSDELIAIAKHYKNVAIDMCWAWSINPKHATDFLRRCIHAVPTNKIFVFGGDAHLPAATVGYSIQARRWLSRCLRQEISDGLISENNAISLAQYLMMGSPYQYFDVAQKKTSLLEASTINVSSLGSAFSAPSKPLRHQVEA